MSAPSISAQTRSITMMCVSVVLFAANVLLVRWVTLHHAGIDGWITTFIRGSVGVLVTVAIFGFGRGLSWRSVFVKPVVLLRGALGGVGILLLYLAIEHLPAGRAVVLNLTYPLFATLFAVLWLDEVPGRRARLWMAAAFVGLMVFLGPGFLAHGISLWDVLALASGVVAGGIVVTIRLLHRTESTATIYIAQCVWSIAIALPVSGAQLGSLSGGVLGWLCLAAVLVAAAQLMMTHAYKALPVNKGSAIQMLLPVLVAAGGFLFLGEALDPLEIAGAALTLYSTWRVIASK